VQLQLGEFNGWVLLGDPFFEDALSKLETEVAMAKRKDPENYKSKNVTKRLAAVTFLVFEKIPQNPAAHEFRLGQTLGTDFRHWRRAKFLGQYRLFFRYDSKLKIIIYSWLNDSETLRAYESKTDAYNVFKRMIAKGKPPTDWFDLLDSTK